MGTSWGVFHVWTAVLVGWTIKAIILKLGGLNAYRATIPFFVGIVLGNQVIGCLWSILGGLLEISTYSVWY